MPAPRLQQAVAGPGKGRRGLTDFVLTTVAPASLRGGLVFRRRIILGCGSFSNSFCAPMASLRPHLALSA